MSLVSYGASDESDASDADDGQITTNVQTKGKAVNTNATSGHISDEDDFDPAVDSTSVSSTSGMRSVNIFDKADLHDSNSDDVVNSTSVTSLEENEDDKAESQASQNLPVPQSLIRRNEAEEELEDEVRPKASEISNAPKPPGRKSKQPVKITIPSLDETTDNDEKESVKKAAPSKTKSGLFSLLPAPVHVAKKEANRPLIPHTLTKKTVPATSNTISSTGDKHFQGSKSKHVSEVASTTDVSPKRLTQFNALTGYDSDSDDEDDKGTATNFFSLMPSSGEKALENTTEITAKRLQSEEVSSSESEVNYGVTDHKPREKSEAGSENGDREDVVEEKEIGPEPGAVNNAPLDFRSVNRLSAWAGSSYGFLGPVGLTGPVPQVRTYQSSSSVPSSSEYNLANPQVSNETNDEDMEGVTDDDLRKFMNDKEFQKLQGKRKRGLEEAINFVDANVDDYVDPTEVSKHLTEETDYVSHKSKDNLPTAQQRRKKQITYLAYQAKERELELKNTWAQSRMTKRQTQSKYGF